MDCSLSGSSVHRILQARILEWVAISFSTLIIIQMLNGYHVALQKHWARQQQKRIPSQPCQHFKKKTNKQKKKPNFTEVKPTYDKLHMFKLCNSCVLMYPCKIITTIKIGKAFFTSQVPAGLLIIPSPLFHFQQTLICFLSLWLSLHFLEFYENRIAQDVLFCWSLYQLLSNLPYFTLYSLFQRY